MNNEIEKLEVKKILDNLEYVSDIHKVFIEDGYKIQEEIPSSQIKELRLNSYNAKLLFNHINNLQFKIDKAIDYIEKNTHNIYADGYRDRITGELLSKEKTPIINRVFSQNPKDLLDILKEVDK